MITTRIIPVLLWDGINCVQTTRFGKRRVFGSLMDAVRVYERRNVDELILLDISGVTTPRFDEIKEFTSQLFCPVTVGGGVRTLKDIEGLLRSGADKVSIRRAATAGFLAAASKKFGAQAVVFALDAWNYWPLRNVCSVAGDAELAGAGEILLTSVMRNGTMQGYDCQMIAAVTSAVTIPVVAHGGCGNPEHMLDAIKAGAHAAAASTMFLFTETTPRDCARYLAKHGVEARVA